MAIVGTPPIFVERADTDERYNHVFTIRTTVFVDEEAIDQDDEYDGFDHLSTHYLAWYGDNPAGAARWRRLNNGNFRLERFAVLQPYRNKGIGRALMQTILAELPRDHAIFVHAQVKNLKFYEKLGFTAEGEPFEEANISHIKMVYQGE
jgi:predicted GNAT family N-acyltransferase